MTQTVNGNLINQHLRMIAGNVTSGKGIFIQLLGCQLALPAIANDAPSPAIPSLLPDTETNHEYTGPATADLALLTAKGNEQEESEQPDAAEVAQVIYERPIYEQIDDKPNVYAPIAHTLPVYEQPAHEHSAYETLVSVPVQTTVGDDFETAEPEPFNAEQLAVLEPADLADTEIHSTEIRHAETDSAEIYHAEIYHAETTEIYSIETYLTNTQKLEDYANDENRWESRLLSQALSENDRHSQVPTEMSLVLIQQIESDGLTAKDTTDSEPESWLVDTIEKNKLPDNAPLADGAMPVLIPQQAESTSDFSLGNVEAAIASIPLKKQQPAQPPELNELTASDLTELTYEQYSIENFIPELTPQLIPQIVSASGESAQQSFQQTTRHIPLALIQHITSANLPPAEATKTVSASWPESWQEGLPESWLEETTQRIEQFDLDIPNVSLPVSNPLLLAGPESLNPGLTPDTAPTIPSVIPSISTPQPSPQSSPQSDTPPANTSDINTSDIDAPPTENFPTEDSLHSDTKRDRFIMWEGLSVGFDSNFDSFDQGSWQILPVLRGVLANGDRLSFTTGINQFSQSEVESVAHIPLTANWQGQRGALGLEVGAGIDFFNRLPSDIHFNTKASIPVGRTATVSLAAQHGPYTANAKTLENQISSWQYGPEIYWQITPGTSFFSKLNIGNYSDGNQEVQSFSRLERKIGESATAAINLTTASFDQNVIDTSGYFSPPDFLIAAAELSWQESINDRLTCGLSGSIGQQRLEGEWAVAYTNQVTCGIEFSPTTQLDLGYRITNTSNGQSLFSDDAYSNQSVFGGLRIQF